MDERIELHTGSLSVAELRAVMESMPADVTFVDATGAVRFYTERYRIFDRRPEHIGRDVVSCHPPEVRPQVSQLMSELLTGWREEAVFLAEKSGRNVHVRYSAVHDAAGVCLGVLEVAQWAEGTPE